MSASLLDSRLARTVLLLLALLPLLLFAYLGSHASMMAGDYCHVRVAQELGPLQGMAHWRNTWNGSYSDYFVHGLLAPLGASAPAVVPALTIALWLVALSALLFQANALAGLSHFPRLTAVTVAAFIMTFTINAFFSPQSLYFYSASLRHTLPIAGITAFFALLILLNRQRDTATSATLALVAAGGALCFVNAGLGETFALFQLLCISLACFACIFFVDRATNRQCRLFLAVGLLATIASLIVILTAPGAARRMDVLDQITAQLNRDFFALATMTLETAFLYLREPELIKGFFAVVGLGLVLMLSSHTAATAEKTVQPGVGPAHGPLLFALACQLLCLPLLLGQMSDDPRVLGRYSLGYSVVLLANLGHIFSIALLAFLRSRASHFLAGHRGRSTRLGALWLLAFLMVSALTLVRGVDWRVSTYLYLTLLALLISLSWQWSYSLPRSVARRAWIVIFASSAVAVLTTLVMLFFAFYASGSVWPRILSFVPYVFILAGLIWAMALGHSITGLGGSSRDVAASNTRLRLCSLLVVLVIGASVLLDHARLIPSFQQYSAEWSAREQQIIAERERGQRTIYVAPLSFDLEYYVDIDRLHKSACPKQYYDVDAILLEDA